MTAATVTAAFASELAQAASAIDDTPASIVYLPEGTHTITATISGKVRTATVHVTEDVLAKFSEDLAERQSRNVKPFGGFDHAQGAASFIPIAFRYEQGKGLILDVEWTEAGRSSVEGRNHRYFSPTFLLGKDGTPAGLPPRGEIGSLVNEPAFEDMPAVAAADATTTQPEQTMLDLLKQLGLVPAEIEDEAAAIELAKQALADLRAKADAEHEIEVEAQKPDTAEIDALKAENQKLKDQLTTAAKARADKAVADAVKCGRIEPLNQKAKDYWHKAILNDPDAETVLASMPSNPALSGAVSASFKTPETQQLPPLARAAKRLETAND